MSKELDLAVDQAVLRVTEAERELRLARQAERMARAARARSFDQKMTSKTV